MKTYNINSIFYSIQGEGLFAGVPMVFVRFSGCNQKCSFCDTEHQSHSAMTSEQIFHVIDNIDANIICFTGGEPFLQLDRELISYLNKQKDFQLHVETNGSIYRPIDEFSVVTVSPKSIDSWKLKKGTVLKIVYGTFSDEKLKQIYSHVKNDFEYFFIQPMFGKNENPTVEFVKHNPEWRLSIQCQKYLKIK